MKFPSSIVLENYQKAFLASFRRFGTLNQASQDHSSVDSVDLSSLRTSVLDKPKPTKTKRASKRNEEAVSADQSPESQISEAQDGSVVLRKPIPKNFIKETLLPHLEHNVAYNCMKFPPDVVLQIGIAYSKLPHFIRQRSIEDALVETFRYRMVDYTAPDCIQLLNTCFQLQGLRSVSVYEDIISRLEVPHVYNSITSLNRLGICRSISKIVNHSNYLINRMDETKASLAQPTSQDSGNPDTSSQVPREDPSLNSQDKKQKVDDLKVKDLFKVDFNVYNDEYRTSLSRPWSYMVKNYKDKKIGSLVERLVNFCENRILPQLEYELKSFDSDELTDLLAVIAQRTERDGTTLDFPVIAILMANIMRLYPTTSLLNSLNNLSSLCRLRIRHEGFLSLLMEDLKNTHKVTNIYHKHLSRCVWSLARYDLLNEVLSELLLHVGRNVPKFSPGCFARLSQVAKYYPFDNQKGQKAFHNHVVKTALCLLTRIDSFSPKDLIFFITGLMELGLLPSESEYFEKKPRLIKPKFDKEDRYLSKNSKTVDTFELLSKVLQTLKHCDQDFDLWEIERLLEATKSSSDFTFLLELFPDSWRNIIHPPEVNS